MKKQITEVDTKKEKSIKDKKKINKLVMGYIKVSIIFIIVIVGVIWLRNGYVKANEFQMTIPVIRETLRHEINKDELNNYINDNPSVVLYVCTASNLDCRNFEEKFKKVIEKKDLQESITYLNLSDIENKEEFFNSFNKLYPYEQIINTYPALIQFTDGKVTDVANGTETGILTIKEVEAFIKNNKIKATNM